MAESQEWNFRDEFQEIVQVGIVVEDIQKIMDGMRDVFGIEPDLYNDMVYKQSLYRGQRHDTPVRSAFYNHFKVQLEFLQPIGEEETIWKDYLKLGQHGLHHLRFDVTDNDRITEVMKEKGIEIWQEGSSIVTPGCKFTYYDSVEKLGFIVEVVTRADCAKA